ncbi:SDR family oxidoreductase [Alkaliphilus hydrothermalis]|uniref:NAD(P)-dependent dehydrogenase (Short-subunit alcohol dehydrogenase family) n=1 Tax=Alkaliphilus hydrothermalis TaxID=1482730 RepID=A0ABS2NRN7_9FIRM|nr:SDR family oxidoreductase [Alkaliphilus hydrothermalis]MBM7615437.1 NAD(P)-dependent dehydrogenase (short-subunit alcohol dehydrogenase family) [Alkaliphilus hydrothermalis]
MTYLEERVVVTGAGQGIGRSIAMAYGKLGAKVVIAEVNEATGGKVEEDMRSLGYDATFIKTDVSKESDVKYMVSETIRLYEGIDTLINNAAISFYEENPLEMSLETWNKIIGINLTGSFLCAKHCGTIMKLQKRGNIINIASTRAFMSEAFTEAYTASKGGVIALTHGLAVSLGQYGIRVNSISPGWIDLRDYEDLRPVDHQQHPVGRVGKPEDVASLCLYLTSPEAAFITGSNFTVDGGMTKKMIYEG